MEQALSAPRALRCLAAYVRQHSDLFVRSGPNVPKPEESATRRRQIETLATAMEDLSTSLGATYEPFEEMLRGLHRLGMFPPNGLVSEVALAFHAGSRTA